MQKSKRIKQQKLMGGNYHDYEFYGAKKTLQVTNITSGLKKNKTLET